MEKFKKFLISPVGKLVIIAVSAVIVYGLLMVFLSTRIMFLFIPTLILCGFFGWKALNKITPNIFLVMGIGAWAIYYLVKGLLSIMIGAVISPIVIAKMITDKVTKTLQETNSKEL